MKSKAQQIDVIASHTTRLAARTDYLEKAGAGIDLPDTPHVPAQ